MKVLNKLYRRVGLLDTFFPYFTSLPDFVLKIVASRFFKKAKQEINDNDFPHHLVFFVTSRCNQKCSHCFYADQISNNPSELNIEDIKLMIKSLRGKLSQVILTGGEPFLRSDLVEICNAFEKLAGVESISIMTNGYMPDRIEEYVGKILKNTSVTLSFQVSLDGIPSQHDSIRGRVNAFKNAVETINRLNQIKRRNKRIHRITTLTTISQKNIHSIEKIIKELKRISNTYHGFGFVRGSTNDTFGIEDSSFLSGLDPKDECYLTLQQMKDAFRQIDRYLWQKVRPSLYYAETKSILQHLLKLKEENYNDFKCMAGIADIIIYPDGDVALCEMLKPFANIRKYDFNAVDLWKNNYKEYKKKIAGCKCAHSCNILSMIKFDESKLFELFKCMKTYSG